MPAKYPSNFAFYNAADDLINRNLEAGRANKIAFVDATGSHTYADIAEKSARFANALQRLGIQREARLAIVMLDSAEMVICFLGAIKAGVIPVPLNTRLSSNDYAYILADCNARGLIVTESLVEIVLNDGPKPEVTLVDGTQSVDYPLLSKVLERESNHHHTAETRPDDICFWLYTSGTTGDPKGVVHLHSHLLATADLYAIPTLQIDDSDTIYSAAKLFFAYGLGNSLTFTMTVGATAVLMPGPPDPVSVCDILTKQNPTLFFGVPTLYAMLLASENLPAANGHSLRLCVSAGEPLPIDLLERWQKAMGIDILDGIGTTEMLHIFISNRAGDVRPGTTGKVIGGYKVRLIHEEGYVCKPGEMGVLEVSGPTSAIMYWNQREKTKETFLGPWTKTGDNFVIDKNDILTYCGRNDDMLKVGGIYVSPFEVEGALVKHKNVIEAAVVGHPDQDNLIKPKAFVVLTSDVRASDDLKLDIQHFVRNSIANYKYPRWIEFVDELPKTATGKIQRFRLR